MLVNGAAGNDPNGTVLELTLADWNSVFARECRRRVPDEPRDPAGNDRRPAAAASSTSPRSSAASRRRAARPIARRKGALIQLAKAMATDHAAQNIRVNTLSPGAVETERLVLRFGDMETARRVSGPKHLLQPARPARGNRPGGALSRQRRGELHDRRRHAGRRRLQRDVPDRLAPEDRATPSRADRACGQVPASAA